MGLWGGIVDGVPGGVGSRYSQIRESAGLKGQKIGDIRGLLMIPRSSVFALNPTVINMGWQR